MIFLKVSLLFHMLGTMYCLYTPFEMIDLTQTFNNATQQFEMKYKERGTQRGFWLQLEEYNSSTHAGTHMDMPCEYINGKQYVDQIPMSRLVAPAAVVDMTSQVTQNRDYGATIQDLQKWERDNQQTLDGKIILLKSGWGTRYGDLESYVGTTGHDINQFHWPNLSPEASQWIVDNRKVIAVGTEALSVDLGSNVEYPVQKMLSQANIYTLKCVASMDKLPAVGAILYAFPMKIGNACAAPVRIAALVPRR